MSSSQSTTARSIIYLGMDVHKDSAGAKTPTRIERLPNDLSKLKRFLDRLGREGELRACYEASGAGYVLHRALREWGYSCDVIAPSLIPKRPGVQRKHDKRDASELARLFGFAFGGFTKFACATEVDADRRLLTGDYVRRAVEEAASRR